MSFSSWVEKCACLAVTSFSRVCRKLVLIQCEALRVLGEVQIRQMFAVHQRFRYSFLGLAYLFVHSVGVSFDRVWFFSPERILLPLSFQCGLRIREMASGCLRSNDFTSLLSTLRSARD